MCRGASCACGGAKTTAASCAPQGFPSNCGTTPWNAKPPSKASQNCTGAKVPCCNDNDVSRLVPYYDLGSKVVLNYWAAFEFDAANKRCEGQ